MLLPRGRFKQGRKFPPRTMGLWFMESVIDDFREAIAAENAKGIRRLLSRFFEEE
ncbi:MAG: hypothetical protein ACE5QF_09400 [Thermoplasmata archaeon]